MELLLQAIEKKLSHVDGERNRWLQYKEEHEQASSNLRDFQQSFRKEILVPIGSKALMPGHLYHTNEIFVGMYRGLFVKCSADKALSVCEHRLGEANKHIDALNVEHKMYKDRLELPIGESVFANPDGAQEIIEEYNEEEEARWREQHKIRIREHKQAEAKERRQISDNDDIDINAILEQAELMEELENDLELLNVNDDEHLMQHLYSSGDQIEQTMERIDSKKPVSQLNVVANESSSENNTDTNDTDVDSDDVSSKEFSSLCTSTTGLSIQDKIKFYEIHLQKTREYFMHNQCTIHNFDEFTDKRVTEECIQNAIEELHETLKNTADKTLKENEKSSISATNAVHEKNTQHFSNANEPRKFHSQCDFDEIERDYAKQNKSKSELLIFYKSQLRNVMKSIAGCTIDLHSREEKRQLYEFLCDRISSLRDEILKEKQIKLEEDFVDDEDIDKNVKQLGRNFEPNTSNFELDDCKDEVTGKRKISFASQPITVTFFEDDEPCVVSQENMNNLIDSTFQFFNSPSSSSASSVCGDDDDDDDNNANGSNEHHPMNSTNDCDMNFSIDHSNNGLIWSPKNHQKSAQIDGSDQIFLEKKANDFPCVGSQNTIDPVKSTLTLHFDHSPNTCTAMVSNDDDIINSPLDIYKKFGGNIGPITEPLPMPSANINRSFCEKNVGQSRSPINEIRKVDEELANNSFSLNTKSLEIPNINAKPTKSILKNSNLVKSEIRTSSIDDDIDDTLDCNEQREECSGFTQVLGDIVERNNTNEKVSNDIETAYTQTMNDASTKSQPKKRVSLFKKSRMS